MYVYLILQISLFGVVLGEPSCNPQFTCFPDAPNNYQVHGMNLTCPNRFICNADYDRTTCDPCVVPSETLCGFICNGSSGGDLNLVPRVLRPFTCPSGQVCNEAYVSCEPCITPECSRFWTCNAQNPQQVTAFGLTFQCDVGKICNFNYVQPCDACIVDTNPVSTTTPFPILPPQYPPNCNDGMSATYPCRPGPPGRGYYYKCRRVGMIYDYEVRLCGNDMSDNCRNLSYICV